MPVARSVSVQSVPVPLRVPTLISGFAEPSTVPAETNCNGRLLASNVPTVVILLAKVPNPADTGSVTPPTSALVVATPAKDASAPVLPIFRAPRMSGAYSNVPPVIAPPDSVSAGAWNDARFVVPAATAPDAATVMPPALDDSK